MTDLVQVRFARKADARQLALVLLAVGIDCRLVEGDGGVALCVAAHQAEQARQELDAYERENPPEEPAPAHPARPALHGLGAALAYCMVLLFFFGADRRLSWSVDWSAVGAAQAGLIQGGAWWRTVTALTLHADDSHLFANLIAGLGFGMLLAQVLGSGLAWLAILLAGALGNGLNALLHPAAHTAIGSSTAIFGALGILAGYTQRRRSAPWRSRIRRWAPLAASSMLLAYLGFGGAQTDVGAHVAGFAVGAGLGLALGRWGQHLPQGRLAQLVYALLAVALLALAWLLALHAGA
ncbi:rhomboid family intramembrane serine protease [Geminicoccus harenae]|uniref:rhomboid family intramembrane serine protease n=2 Tax=Geminicoccus harenae TaxID=2498453 RepID=UPI001C965A5F|nr:rhomboid family intramembrane serine protease [Geminicoccus harenae]